jgi:hypothetical protein
LIPKSLEQITKEDLQALIDNAVLERRTLDYKQSLPRRTDSSKKEFLADVSSFANAAGGDLVYGISQDRETGEPRELLGLIVENVDQEILRLENLVRNGIDPRIPSVEIQPCSLSNSRVALIIRVKKSWISPHRVILGGHDKFYSRSSNGKYPLDVTELRTAFTVAGSNVERIKKFREERISQIFANETPLPFLENAKIVAHIIPLIALDPVQYIDVKKIAEYHSKLKPMVCMGWDYRYNLDGFLTFALSREGVSYSYVQVFRSGIIEAVEGLLLKPQKEELLIPSVAYEKELVNSIREYLSVLRELNVGLPALIFLTFVGIKGYSMYVPQTHRFWLSGRVPTIERDIIFLPEAVIESYEDKVEEILRPIFDAVWNSCGLERSVNYDENGHWNPIA